MSAPPSDETLETLRAALAHSELRCAQLLEAMGEGFCVLEVVPREGLPNDYRFVSANAAFASILKVQDAVGHTARELFPNEPQGWFDIYDAVLSSGTAVRFERGLVDTDLTLQLTAFRQGERQLGVVFADITARKLAEQARADSEARLRHLNASLERQVVERASLHSRTWAISPDLLGAVNCKGYFETSNPAWLQVLGWSAAEVAATPVIELLHPDDLARTRAYFKRSLGGEALFRFQNRYRHKAGGYRWISWAAVVDGDLLYCSGRDVTDEREAEAELLEARAVRPAERLQAAGRLTDTVAQDFSALLAGVATGLDLADKRIADGRADDARRYIAIAQAQTRRASGAIQRLLRVSPDRPPTPKPVDLHHVATGLGALIALICGPAIDVVLQGGQALWSAQIDAGQLEDAILGLVRNAALAMPSGGRLTIVTANLWLDPDAAAERGLHPGQYVSLQVADTGCGMSPDVLAQACQPFFTTRAPGEADGVGLAIVDAFARQSGGCVCLSSTLGCGTRAELVFPRFVSEPPELAAPRPAQHGTTQH